MKPLIVANWKCNPASLAEAEQLFNEVQKGMENAAGAGAVICPPFVYLSALRPSGSLSVGGQDCFYENKGAFTGEVSPSMLKDLGCEYVILGHSERRKYQKETDELINKKVKAVLEENLKVILCIDKVQQIKKGLEGIKADNFKNIIAAYEPLFAIGTGKACSVEKAGAMRKAILSAVKHGISVLYGGSVNSQNAADFIEKAGFQGLLVGGASLKAEEFIGIVKNVAKKDKNW